MVDWEKVSGWLEGCGIGIGVGTETVEKTVDSGVVESYLNPWSLDKGIHTVFSYGVTGVVDRATKYVARTDDDWVEQYVPHWMQRTADAVDTPRNRAAASAAAIGVFSIMKELSDPHIDELDVTANYVGWSLYQLKELCTTHQYLEQQ